MKITAKSMCPFELRCVIVEYSDEAKVNKTVGDIIRKFKEKGEDAEWIDNFIYALKTRSEVLTKNAKYNLI